MKSQKGNVGLYLIIFVSIAIVAGAVWFVMGKNRIITAVPESGSDGQRVILVTPQATPTSKFDEATDSAETEEVSPTKEPSPTTKPVAKPTNTPAPTKEEEEPTDTPTPAPTSSDEETPTPTEPE